jgi:tetraacyldisaccharide 4'-kinase
LLSPNYKVATLSRGYKRKSEGFVLADKTSDAEILGDEPFQYYRKFPNIQVAVDADRKTGIERLLSLTKKPEVILLDDAYQHRRVKAGFYILLTSYGDLYSDDFMLPTGNLREGRNGAKRANVIIVTKCPPDLSAQAQNEIRTKLKIEKQQELFFSFINYDDSVYSANHSQPVSDIKNAPKLLLAGIAKPEPFFAYLQSGNDIVLQFPDHHHFSEDEIREIKAEAGINPIVTTEKDYVRLEGKLPQKQLYCLPIKTGFIKNQEKLDAIVLNCLSLNKH